ncbi:BppU family phage baseplate upper protein [Listeria ivanovii]|nr:BppU family phage baseplate upper protein [Listeria ivanovii]
MKQPQIYHFQLTILSKRGVIMNIKKYNLALDFMKNKSQNKIVGRVGEIQSMLWHINLSTDETTQPLGDLIPVFYAEIKEGIFVRDDGSENNSINILDNSNGIIEYKPNKRLFAKPGRLKNCYFALEKTAPSNEVTLGPLDQLVERTSTQSFEIIVEKDAMQDNVELESFDPTINELKRYLEDHLGDSVAISTQALQNAEAAHERMDNLENQIDDNNLITTTLSAVWQKYKLTNDDGIAKIFPTNVTKLSDFNETGYFYVDSTAASKLTDVPLAQGFLLENRKLITGNTVEQTIRYFNPDDGEECREFSRYGTSTWRETASVLGSQIYTDNSYKKTVIWSGSSYFLDTHIFSWDSVKVRNGVLLEFSRYAPGTGVLDYGYIEYFFSKEYLVRNNNKATWLNMPGSTEAAKKTIRLTPTSVSGDATNGQAPSTSYALRAVTIF